MKQLSGVFFDLDGTIFVGDKLLPGVKETLAWLRSQRKKVMFLTNTTIRTRAECQDNLRQLGLEVPLSEIVTAGYMAALYLREQQPRPVVLAIGESALLNELREQGINCRTDASGGEITHVLVGMDRHFTYAKLNQAMQAVRRGAELVAANPDPNCPVEGGLIPDTGALVQAIEAASGGAAVRVIGKPSAYYAKKVLEWSGLRAEQCLMVGDRIDTDILFGVHNGLRTALVLTGVTSGKEISVFHAQPDYIWESLHELIREVRA